MFLYSYRISLRLMLPLLLGSILVARPAYSIPTTLKEGQQLIGKICADYGIEFCAYVPQEDKADAKYDIGTGQNPVATMDICDLSCFNGRNRIHGMCAAQA